MKTVLQIIEEAGGLATFTWTRIENPPFMLLVIESLGERGTAGIIARQLIRSGTSVGAQYREACRARSIAEFVSKVESATQELEETCYWFELLADPGLVERQTLTALACEADELLAMLVSSSRTAKKRRRGREEDLQAG